MQVFPNKRKGQWDDLEHAGKMLDGTGWQGRRQKIFQGWNRKKDRKLAKKYRKIAKKGRKIALLSLYLQYLYHI